MSIYSTPTKRLQCEALVIGTGAGGASVAATLVDAGMDVLMLDEGPYIRSEDAPVGLAQSMQTMWRGGGLLTTMGTSQVSFAEGRCIGGGTEINSAIFQRAPDDVVEAWARQNRIKEFSTTSLRPYYDRAARILNVSLTPGELGSPTRILANAGRSMGWKVTHLERAQRQCVGTNMCAAGCPTGGKQSMSATLIPYALARGARIVPNCLVKKLRARRSQIVGASCVETDDNGRRIAVEVRADHIFLCAGTTHTPVLIRRSGIPSPAVRHFQLHPTVRVLARFPGRVDAHRYRVPLVAITEFIPEMRFGGSIFSVATYAMALAEDWELRRHWLADFSHYAMYYAMIKPDGVGRILCAPGVDEPITTYRLTERDWHNLEDATKKLSLALLASGAEHVVPSVRGHPGWRKLEDLTHRQLKLPPGRTSLMSIHLFSSCPMGERSETCPVDSYGHLIGTRNVVVADGSVLPSAPGVNPQATIMALAFRAADRFLELRGPQRFSR